MTSLPHLLSRLESAEGADRELDAAICAWSCPTLGLERCKRSSRGGWHHPVHGLIAPPERYTASLDAALQLVERVLPGVYLWRLDFDDEPNEDRPYSFDLYHADVSATGAGATSALAVLTALLHALVARDSASPPSSEEAGTTQKEQGE